MTSHHWRLCLVPPSQLVEAKELLIKHRASTKELGTAELRRASALYQSAFHPDTGELQNLAGRMSFQVPGGMLITGAMLAFYRSTPAVVFWQWVNQSFNALVNYTNRNAASALTTQQLGVAYTSATSAALVTALGLKKLFSIAKKFAFFQRYVPFMAVAAANMVNIPLMRQNELLSGVTLFDDSGNQVAVSKVGAVKGISQVVGSRILMAAPGMLLLPLLMRRVETLRWYRTPLNLPLQTLLCGVSLTLMVPLSCACFDQRCSIPVSSLEKKEPSAYETVRNFYGTDLPDRLYFNKGL
ncbi:Tricarboxylate/iron carrier [Trinorchestia longiramus]|nr:Tricarboxylate/iron carrier [Trinorchestia longiramus]